MMLKITIFCLLLSVITAELWERDMSEEIYIEASHEGFQQVSNFLSLLIAIHLFSIYLFLIA